MSESQPRFTITLTLHDNRSEQQTLAMAIPVDEELTISARVVDEMKAGAAGVVLGLGPSMEQTVSILRRREFRKDLLIEAATLLGARLAERMEDAEGWHDTSRIETARELLGYKP